MVYETVGGEFGKAICSGVMCSARPAEKKSLDKPQRPIASQLTAVLTNIH